MSQALMRCSCLAGGVRAPFVQRRPATAGRVSLRPLRAAATDLPTFQIEEGRFVDYRWKDGTWLLEEFKGKDGNTDWDAVIDAEIERRRLLEKTPIPSINEDPVNFDTGVIPWYVWMRRFHLPEAEKLNGRAAMMGYVLALVVDKLTGAGLLDQQESFLGKLALHITVFAILLFRSSSDVNKYKNLVDEATFYDKQWNATWEGKVRPSENNNNN